jgi:hypothetical protein
MTVLMFFALGTYELARPVKNDDIFAGKSQRIEHL